MDRLFTTNLEDTEVYDPTHVDTENLRDNPPAANLDATAVKSDVLKR